MIKGRAVKITGQEEVFMGDALFQVKSGNYLRNVGHTEHIGYIGGKPGTMKSTILRYIAAAGQPDLMPFGFKLNLEGRRIVWFDGEQPRDIVVGSINHIIELSGGAPGSDLSYLDMYELSGIDTPKERRAELWRICYSSLAPRMDTAVIIIDGLANFVNNINDYSQIDDIMNKFTTTAKRLNCMIIILSHITNTEGGKKLYGMGGTRLDQLASWGFYMESMGPYFIMSQAKGRYGFVAPKAFRFGKEKNELIIEPYYPF